MKIRKWIGLGLFLIGVGFLAAFFLAQHIKAQAVRNYDTLRTSVENTIMVVPPDEQSSRLDFRPLLEENEDTVGWLQIPGLSLSLPVVHGQDDQYYLHKGFDNSDTPCGCLFLSADGSIRNPYNVIFGHNMANGSMFGKLTQYRQEAFGKENPEFYLYTPEGDYRCVIFACREDEDSSDTYNVNRILTSVEYGDFLVSLKGSSLYEIGPSPTAADRVITLSTCGDPFSSGLKRFTVHAVMEKMQ